MNAEEYGQLKQSLIDIVPRNSIAINLPGKLILRTLNGSFVKIGHMVIPPDLLETTPKMTIDMVHNKLLIQWTDDIDAFVPVVVSDSMGPGEALFVSQDVFNHLGEIDPRKVVYIKNLEEELPKCDYCGFPLLRVKGGHVCENPLCPRLERPDEEDEDK